MRSNTLVAVTTGLMMVFVLSASSARAQVDPQDGPPGAEAWDSDNNTALAAWECPLGDVCFWNGSNGTGSRCAWGSADPDWLNGNIRCSWAQTET